MWQLSIFNFRIVSPNKPMKAQNQLNKAHNKGKGGFTKPTTNLNKSPQPIKQE